MHNGRWLEAQVSRKECCCNKLAKIRKELGDREIETNMEQCSCCSNPGALTEKISHGILKRFRFGVS